MIKKLLLVLLVLIIAGATSIMTYVNRDYAQPKYDVILASGDVEFRSYGPMMVAETTAPGDMNTAMNAGFRRIAKYIFSNQIAMTSPVLGQAAPAVDGADAFTTSFIMPPGLSAETMPMPVDSAVTLANKPERRVVAARFSGLMSTDKIQEAVQKILAFTDANNLEVVGQPQVAYYNNPYTTLPWMRRNEVMVPVDYATE